MKIGDKVFLSPTGNNCRRGSETKEMYIQKIGGKYLWIWDGKNNYNPIQFHKETFRQVTEYSPGWELYFELQEILDVEERSRLSESIYKHLGRYTISNKYSLDQLRRINAILEEKNESI